MEEVRRRRATQPGEANPPSPSGCGGRPLSPASLLLGVPQGVLRRRRSWDPAPWRSQRGSREVSKPALKMLPLVVTVIGNRTRISRAVASLKKQLIRRGLRVYIGDDPWRKAAEEPDVVLIPCPDSDWRQMGCVLEERWNRQWMNWYTLRAFPT